MAANIVVADPSFGGSFALRQLNPNGSDGLYSIADYVLARYAASPDRYGALNIAGDGELVGTFTDTAYLEGVSSSNLTEVTRNIDVSRVISVSDTTPPPKYIGLSVSAPVATLQEQGNVNDLILAAATRLTSGTYGGIGSYYLGVSPPSDGGTWVDQGDAIEDTLENFTVVQGTYKLWRKVGGVPSYYPLKIAGNDLAAFTVSDFNKLANYLELYLSNTGGAQYSLQTDAPTEGVWANAGTIEDSKRVASEFEYIASNITGLEYNTAVYEDGGNEYLGVTGTYVRGDSYIGETGYTGSEFSETNYTLAVTYTGTANTYAGTYTASENFQNSYLAPFFLGEQANYSSYSNFITSYTLSYEGPIYASAPAYEGASYTGTSYLGTTSYVGTLETVIQYILTYGQLIEGYTLNEYLGPQQYATTFGGYLGPPELDYIDTSFVDPTGPDYAGANVGYIGTAGYAVTYTGTFGAYESAGYTALTYSSTITYTGQGLYTGPTAYLSADGAINYSGPPTDYAGYALLQFLGAPTYTTAYLGGIFTYTADYGTTYERVNEGVFTSITAYGNSVREDDLVYVNETPYGGASGTFVGTDPDLIQYIGSYDVVAISSDVEPVSETTLWRRIG